MNEWIMKMGRVFDKANENQKKLILKYSELVEQDDLTEQERLKVAEKVYKMSSKLVF